MEQILEKNCTPFNSSVNFLTGNKLSKQTDKQLRLLCAARHTFENRELLQLLLRTAKPKVLSKAYIRAATHVMSTEIEDRQIEPVDSVGKKTHPKVTPNIRNGPEEVSEPIPDEVTESVPEITVLELPTTEEECVRLKTSAKTKLIATRIPLGFYWKSVEDPYSTATRWLEIGMTDDATIDDGSLAAALEGNITTIDNLYILDRGIQPPSASDVIYIPSMNRWFKAIFKSVFSGKKPDELQNVSTKMLSRYWDIRRTIYNETIVQTGSDTIEEYIDRKYGLDMSLTCLSKTQLIQKIGKNADDLTIVPTTYSYNVELDTYLDLEHDRVPDAFKSDRRVFAKLMKPSLRLRVNKDTEFFMSETKTLDPVDMCIDQLVILCYKIVKNTHIFDANLNAQTECDDSTEIWVYPKHAICKRIEYIHEVSKRISLDRTRHWIQLKNSDITKDTDYVRVFVPMLNSLMADAILNNRTHVKLSRKQVENIGLTGRESIPEKAYIRIDVGDQMYYFRTRDTSRIRASLVRMTPLPPVTQFKYNAHVIETQIFPALQFACERDAAYAVLNEEEVTLPYVMMVFRQIIENPNGRYRRWSSHINSCMFKIPGMSYIMWMGKRLFSTLRCMMNFIIKNPVILTFVASACRIFKILYCLYENGVTDSETMYGLALLMLRRFCRPASVLYKSCKSLLDILKCAYATTMNAVTFHPVHFIQAMSTQCSPVLKALGRAGEFLQDMLTGIYSGIRQYMPQHITPDGWFTWLATNSPFPFAQSTIVIRDITNIIDMPMNLLKLQIAINLIIKNPLIYFNLLSFAIPKAYLPIPAIINEIMKMLSDRLAATLGIVGARVDVYKLFLSVCQTFGDRIIDVVNLVAGLKASFDIMTFLIENIVCRVKQYIRPMPGNAICCESVEGFITMMTNQINAETAQNELTAKPFGEVTFDQNFRWLSNKVDKAIGNDAQPSVTRISDLVPARKLSNLLLEDRTKRGEALRKYLINYEVADDWNFATLAFTGTNKDHGLGQG